MDLSSVYFISWWSFKREVSTCSPSVLGFSYPPCWRQRWLCAHLNLATPPMLLSIAGSPILIKRTILVHLCLMSHWCPLQSLEERIWLLSWALWGIQVSCGSCVRSNLPRHSWQVTSLSPPMLWGMGSFLMWMIQVGSRIKTPSTLRFLNVNGESLPLWSCHPLSLRDLISCSPLFDSFPAHPPLVQRIFAYCMQEQDGGGGDCWQPGSFILLIFGPIVWTKLFLSTQ